MWLYFYVEEPSAEAALVELVPIILKGYEYEYEIFPFEGKHALFRKLPGRLKSYQHRLDTDWRVIVLVDRDDDDCIALKERLNDLAKQANLRTRTESPNNFQVINRVVVEELEAWFFGDVEAIVKAYPRVDANLGEQAGLRDPDTIKGGTWEKLEHILKHEHPGGLEKIRAAQEIAQYMNPDENRSQSFRVFKEALINIFNEK